MKCDVLILGSGVGGLSVALDLPDTCRVLIVSKRSDEYTATAWAQGGIASVLSPEDSFASHAEDTLRTGCGLSRPSVVNTVVEEGPARIAALQRLGAEFTRVSHRGSGPPGSPLLGADAEAALDLGMEGGHSVRRIVHAADQTGKELHRALLGAVRAKSNVLFLEDHMAVDLVEAKKLGRATAQVLGAYLFDQRKGEVIHVSAGSTVLATGGAGKVYLYTSNPDVATGDGLAMAYRAGAALRNMEFFQFHPTCFYDARVRTFLISEALRGEGGKLQFPDGTPFMQAHHPEGDLATRDVVARAIDYEMKRTGLECVHLDIRHLGEEAIERKFPFILKKCLEVGIDVRREPIPVVPAAHYLCGGIEVDLDGRTSLPGLWAVGEVACTGLHGANRLASNSLLEGLVFGHRVAKALQAEGEGLPSREVVPPWDVGQAAESDEAVVVTQNWDELRRCMWNYVGIVRTTKRLNRANRRIHMLQEEIREYYWNHLVTRDLLELRNIADVAAIIVASALHRKESRGLHYTLDHPERDPALDLHDTRIFRGQPAHTVASDFLDGAAAR